MSSPGASTPADASTLGTLTVTALNVGMKDEDSFKSIQGLQVARLAGIIMEWLEGPGAAAVALNDIHSTIAEKVLRASAERAGDEHPKGNQLLEQPPVARPSVVYLPLRALFT